MFFFKVLYFIHIYTGMYTLHLPNLDILICAGIKRSILVRCANIERKNWIMHWSDFRLIWWMSDIHHMPSDFNPRFTFNKCWKSWAIFVRWDSDTNIQSIEKSAHLCTMQKKKLFFQKILYIMIRFTWLGPLGYWRRTK